MPGRNKLGEKLVMDLGCIKEIEGFYIKDVKHTNRGTKDFRVFVWNTKATSWTQVLNGTLEDSAKI